MPRTCARAQDPGNASTAPEHCDEKKIVITGRWLKIASIMDEEFLEDELITEPDEFVPRINEAEETADIFTFAQKIPDVVPRYKYDLEWDNFAVIPITTFSDWWENRVERDVRKAVNRAKKSGVVTKQAEFNDEFVEGIRRIYNESPVRQGKPFWHYQKDFDVVKAENSTYADRSVCIGAYYNEELIGFIRMLYVGTVATTLQVISQMKHFDKKPTNALIAKAVEICAMNKMSHFVYSSFLYNNTYSSLTEFKRRNGFEQVLVPRYYIPLTRRGRIALRLGLHLPLVRWCPSPLMAGFRKLRSHWNNRINTSHLKKNLE